MGRYRPHTPGKRSIAAGLVDQDATDGSLL
jgi:hypothetical protein